MGIREPNEWKEDSAVPTPSMEDYLERIYLTIEEKGYVRSRDIAAALDVLPSSVTKMMQKLDEMGLGNYEKYGGFTLTQKGNKLAKRVVETHAILENFLEIIGVEGNIYEEVERLEHYISKETTVRISMLVDFLNEYPDIQEKFHQYCVTELEKSKELRQEKRHLAAHTITLKVSFCEL